MEKCRNPRAALVVPDDRTLPESPGEDFLAFLVDRLVEGVWATTSTACEDRLLEALPRLSSVAEALLLLLGMGWVDNTGDRGLVSWYPTG